MHVINSQLVRTQIANFATGATRVRISRKNLCKIELPFPPLAEQRRIAEQLDTADRILRLREQAIAKLDQLAQSLFYQYDSDASIQYKLSDISEIVSGATPKTEIAEYWGDDICWITPRELTDLPDIFVSDTERKITQKGLRSCAASVLPTNSVLFSSRAPIGHVAINSLPMATNQGFKSFVVKPDLVEPIYLYYWLKSRKRQLQALGVGATFKEVSKSIVSAIDISLPPILTQREFVARTQTIRALKLNMQKGMKDSSALSLTLQNSAFSMA
jgi:type I restriction enzyme S subunit